MAYRVITQEITDTPAVLNLGPQYNDVDSVVHVPAGGGSIWTGGKDMEESTKDDTGIEREAGEPFQITKKSGGDIWVVAASGDTVTVKIEIN